MCHWIVSFACRILLTCFTNTKSIVMRCMVDLIVFVLHLIRPADFSLNQLTINEHKFTKVILSWIDSLADDSNKNVSVDIPIYWWKKLQKGRNWIKTNGFDSGNTKYADVLFYAHPFYLRYMCHLQLYHTRAQISSTHAHYHNIHSNTVYTFIIRYFAGIYSWRYG